jgi:putative ATPase
MNLQGDLFHKSTFSKPLAYRLRPRNLKDFYGQKKVLDFLAAYEGRQLPHLILWGPPGTGKTTLAHIIAGDSKFFSFNAVTSGVPALRKLIDEIKEQREVFGQDCVLFIDEIHRFNKAQQDALLPHLERGDFHLIGATTE